MVRMTGALRMVIEMGDWKATVCQVCFSTRETSDLRYFGCIGKEIKEQPRKDGYEYQHGYQG
jgi:hypothetical protein